MCCRRLGSTPAGASSVLAELASGTSPVPSLLDTPAGRLTNMLVIAVGICIASYGGAPAAAAACCTSCSSAAAACHTHRPPSFLPQAPEPAARCTPLTLQHAEINFVLIGVLLQMASVATESTRLTLVQILLQVRLTWRWGSRVACRVHRPAVDACSTSQCTCTASTLLCLDAARQPTARPRMPPCPQRRGIKLNPITTLYLIAPCCFVFLCVPFVSGSVWGAAAQRAPQRVPSRLWQAGRPLNCYASLY